MRRLTRRAMLADLATKGIGGLLAFIIVFAVIGAYAAGTAAIGGFFLMLLIGIIHSYAVSVPAMGFLTSWGIFFLLRVVMAHLFHGVLRNGTRQR